MSQYIGMIPDEVDQFATALETEAQDLEDTLTTLTSKLSTTTWTGDDRVRFEDAWQGTISVNLQNAAQQLRDAAGAARDDAENQRTASS
jgi:uncharacterized protein YukE